MVVKHGWQREIPCKWRFIAYIAGQSSEPNGPRCTWSHWHETWIFLGSLDMVVHLPTREFVSHWASFYVLLVHSMFNILFILYVISLSYFFGLLKFITQCSSPTKSCFFSIWTLLMAELQHFSTFAQGAQQRRSKVNNRGCKVINLKHMKTWTPIKHDQTNIFHITSLEHTYFNIYIYYSIYIYIYCNIYIWVCILDMKEGKGKDAANKWTSRTMIPECWNTIKHILNTSNKDH